MNSNLSLDSVNDEQRDEKEEMESDVETTVDIDWENHSKTYEVVSDGEAGFDRVTRPDYASAKKAAEAHEDATENECEINLI